MRLKTFLPIVVIVAAVSGAFLLVATRKTVEPQPVERRLQAVAVATVQPETIQLEVASQGTVAPRTESQLIPEVSGPVVWMSPSLVTGGYFEQGDVLARVDPARYQTALERAIANVERARGEFEYAHATLERQRQLAEEEIVSPLRFEEAQRGETTARANLADAEAALGDARRDLERTEIRAPFEGRVRDEQVDLGQYVNRGTPFATLYATDYLEVRLPVADDQLAFFENAVWERDAGGPNPRVRLYTRFAGADHDWWGEIVRTEGEIDPLSRMVHVIARVRNPIGEDGTPLPVGLFVQASIEARLEESVFVLPRAALYDATRVVVVDDEDRLRLRVVTIVRLDRDTVIVGDGLVGGERVAAAAPAEIVEGSQVRPFVRGSRGVDS